MIKKIIILSLLILAGNSGFAQAIKVKPAIWSVDYVKAKEGQLTDLLEFFRLNWAAARVQAKKKHYIQDYKLYVLPEATDYQVILMTKYKDQTQYDQREENFKKIFAQFKPLPIPVNGKGSRDMSDIIKSEEFYELEQ